MQWLFDNFESIIPVAGVIYYFFSLYLNAKKEEQETRKEIIERRKPKKRNYHQPVAPPDYSEPLEPSHDGAGGDVLPPHNQTETVASEEPRHTPKDYWNPSEQPLVSYQEELIRAQALLEESWKRKQQAGVNQKHESNTPPALAPSNTPYRTALRQHSQLKQAFILKEILDSPRSLHS